MAKRQDAAERGWDTPFSMERSLSIIEDLALRHCAQAQCPQSAEIVELIRNHDYASLSRYEVDYAAEWDVFHLVNVRQALAFFSKMEDLPCGADKKQTALLKWTEAEGLCRKSNEFFRNLYGNKDYVPVPNLVRAIEHARRQIRRTLGSCPDIGALRLRFGPGATTTIKKSEACPSNKMGDGLNCSARLYASKYFPAIMQEIPHWLGALGVVPEFGAPMLPNVALSHGKLAFVPKNAWTYRIVTPEPTLNGFIQLGVGDVIRDRLRSAGVDLRDQTHNQRLARVGSLTGELATLDLSSASDTIATELVKLLLPDDWFSLLAALRTPTVLLVGQKAPQRLEKFSGMGNGFTFPLESLIFWALTAVYDPGCSVYGDDIICKTSAVDQVTWLLQACGFVVNTAKSCYLPDVPFRESCGADYYKGFDVRPFYQRTLVSCETLYTLHNFYYRRRQDDDAAYVKGLIPPNLRLFGPDGYGDGHLLSQTFYNRLTMKMAKKGWTGISFETYRHKEVTQVTFYPGDWVSPLYSIYVSGGEPLFPVPMRSLLLKRWREGRGSWRLCFDDGTREGVANVTQSLDFDLVMRLQVSKLPDGRPQWTLPGTNGYKRITIYTLR